jgi:chaperone required for assembly of F1-ATPase
VTKRFYADSAIIAVADGESGVALDGRPIRTPGGALMTLPAPALAEAIAAEWSAQEARVQPLSMPLMRLAATAIDRVGRERDAVVAHIAAYGGSDLLCYRTSAPEALAALRSAVEAMDDFRLSALSQLTAACGSLLIALAVCARRIGAEEAIAASQLDEAWQAEKWGQDAEAEARRENLAREITDAVRFLDLLEC